MPKQIIKNILTVTHGIIAHGTNCRHAFGSGMAGAIKKKWPIVYESFMQQGKGEKMLGTSYLVRVNDDDLSPLWVANCYTQLDYGHMNIKYASPNAIYTALDNVLTLAKFFDVPVYMPKIGAGLGGLDWSLDVEPIISKLEEEHDTVITVCNLM